MNDGAVRWAQMALAFLAGIALRTIVGDDNGLLLVSILGTFLALGVLTWVARSLWGEFV